MRRVTVAALLAASLVLAALTAAAVSLAAETGPKCADLDSANVNYRQNTDGTYTLGVELVLAGNVAACKQITYTLTIENVGSNTVELPPQKGNKQFLYANFSDTDNQVCIFATTSSAGGHVHDRGPDTGCVALQAGPVGGNVGMG